MARPVRIEYEGALYHITACGNENNLVFWDRVYGSKSGGIKVETRHRERQRIWKVGAKDREEYIK